MLDIYEKLNSQGKKLNIIKNRVLKKELPADIIELLMMDYEKNIQSMVMNDNLSLPDFVSLLLKDSRYSLSKQELEQLTKQKIRASYENDIESNGEYDLEIENNKLIITKEVSITKEYYKNFLGIDLESEEQVENGWYYTPPYKSTEIYSREHKLYTNFATKRLKIVTDDIIKRLHEANIVSQEEGAINKVVYDIDMQECISKVKLHIDISKTAKSKENLKTINSFIRFVEELAERHLALSLYS